MSGYEVPSWAGKPPSGLHLDVLKDDKLVQKLMIDGKKCYFFGRNANLNDVVIDHASCSRVHATLVYHKFLNIAYLVDLGSTHGTFIGSIRIEAHKPTQLQINSKFHFGASTRKYILRERITSARNIMEELPISENEHQLASLPEQELDNLTEFNTAHNRRISMLGITEDASTKKNAIKAKRNKKNVHFNEDEIVINPEDVDPSVGRFRNLVTTTVIPSANSAKKIKLDLGISAQSHHHPTMTTPPSELAKNMHPMNLINLYQGLNPPGDANEPSTSGESGEGSSLSLGSKLGLLLPNPAPDVTPIVETRPVIPAFKKPAPMPKLDTDGDLGANEPKKKKYAKEAWPGRKPFSL